MKTTKRSVTALLMTAASKSAIAHPGDHAAMSASEQAAHVAGDPWHVAVTITVTIAALAVVHTLRRQSRRDR